MFRYSARIRSSLSRLLSLSLVFSFAVALAPRRARTSPPAPLPGLKALRSSATNPPRAPDPIRATDCPHWDPGCRRLAPLRASASATITASPNPIRVCDGSGLGVTTLTWSGGGREVEVRVGSASGPLFATRSTGGSWATGKWVSDGTSFVVTDATTGAALASVTVRVTNTGCGPNGATITASPNPIRVCDGSGLGVTTLTWSGGGREVEVRVGSASGPLFATRSTGGSWATGKWVSNGTSFVVTDAATGEGLTSVTVGVTTEGCVVAPPDEALAARADAGHRTGGPGEDLFSGNYHWSLPLVDLPGRAGHDLNLSLSYNSLVWTRAGTSIIYDLDLGAPAPGFRLGFPELAGPYLNASLERMCYLLILPSGGVVELRRSMTGSDYEAEDGSHARLSLTGDGASLVTSDGTRYVFAGLRQCVEVRDRNGNLISVQYNQRGKPARMIDTLGRELIFSYGSFDELLSIARSGEASPLVTFGYGEVRIETSFEGLRPSLENSRLIPVLAQVGLADGSRHVFAYNSYGQVTTITRYAGALALATTSYDLPASAGAPQVDCPRFTRRTETALEWGGAVTAFTFAARGSNDAAGVWAEEELPDGTLRRELLQVAGWARGLRTRVETWAGGRRRQRVDLRWEQATPVAYQSNPRVAEIRVEDEAGENGQPARARRTFILYTNYNLPSVIDEYDGSGVIRLRRTENFYQLAPEYTNRRLIGLPAAQMVYDGRGALAQRIEYRYDEPAALEALPAPAPQHDSANFGSGMAVGRGNLTSVIRRDVTGATPDRVIRFGYHLTGTISLIEDGGGRRTRLGYADDFTSGAPGFQTFSYPTTREDPDGFISRAGYDYRIGAVTRTADPNGATLARSYDGAGRLTRIVNQVSGAYTRYEYTNDHRFVISHATINDLASEQVVYRYLDGHGRLRSEISAHPGSAGGLRAVWFIYDARGREVARSNATEIDGTWQPAGEDAGGWAWRRREYDWQGRMLAFINPDGTSQRFTYDGCGCAGPQVVTIEDEVGRRRDVTYDELGRPHRTRIYHWGGGNGVNVYSTRVSLYNALDQVTSVKVYLGAESADLSCPSATCQESVLGYDGHGRIASSREPGESAPTTYRYIADDAVQTITDARGASASFSYNGRGLVTGISYSAPAGVAPTPGVSFGYDAAGNRSWMADGLGRVDYSYDAQSRLVSESRSIDALGRAYHLDYRYNLSGELTEIADWEGQTLNYAYDPAGRLVSVAGAAFGGHLTYLSVQAYRAWDAPQRVSYGDGSTVAIQYDRRGRVAAYDHPGLFTARYQYFADGRLRSVESGDHRLDRTFSYDHAGRVEATVAGGAAGFDQAAPTLYRQTYGYDAFDHLISRDGNYWWTHSPLSYRASFSDDRLTSLIDQGISYPYRYDPAGNIVGDGVRAYAFDAAGRTAGGGEGYDGDGRLARRAGATTEYDLRSTPLGGRVLITLDAQGNKSQVYVHAGGNVLAEQRYWSGDLLWRHTDPHGTILRHGASGKAYAIDPLGVSAEAASGGEIADYWNGLYQPQMAQRELAGASYGHPSRSAYGVTCRLDGAAIDCEQMLRQLDRGSAGLAGANFAGGGGGDDGVLLAGLATWASGRAKVRAGDGGGLRITEPGGSIVPGGLIPDGIVNPPVFADAPISGWGFLSDPPQVVARSMPLVLPPAPLETVRACQGSLPSSGRMSDAGLNFIAGFERLVLNLYHDPGGGHCTIGYGHLLHLGACNDRDRKRYGRGITKEQALELYRQDIAQTEVRVNQLITAPLNQNQYDALVSVTFNVGTRVLNRTRFQQAINNLDYERARELFPNIITSGGVVLRGLVRRRNEERQLFGQRCF